MRWWMGMAGLAAAMLAAPALAQDEVVVTGTRLRAPDASTTSGVGIKRRADFAVERVTVYGDARDKAQRRKEILDTVRGAIQLGAKRGIQLAFGEAVIQPLTLANVEDKLTFDEDDDRKDAEQVEFVIKTPLDSGDALATIDRLAAFRKAVPLVGRAEIKAVGEPGVSIVSPSQYRGAILAAIAADANAAARAFGPDYVVEVDGLNRAVRWVLTSPTEVLLYLDHELRVVPKR